MENSISHFGAWNLQRSSCIALFCTISHKGLEHSWFFVSKRVLEPKPHRYQQTIKTKIDQGRHTGMILVCEKSAEVCNFQEHSQHNSAGYSSAQPELSLSFISPAPVRLNEFFLIPKNNLLAVKQCLKDLCSFRILKQVPNMYVTIIKYCKRISRYLISS